jgi:hypothetical protein
MDNLKTAPSISELARRLTAIEEKLGGKLPADFCRFCGGRALRLQVAYSPDEKGNVEEKWGCSACGKVDTRVSRPR